MTLTASALAGVGLVVFLGALVQRVTGMGMALVAAPLLVLLLGATTGVQTLQVIGLFTCLASAIVLRRDINLRRAGALLLAAAIGLAPGVWVARTVPASWLNIMIGAITLIALAATALLRTLTLFQGTKGVVVAGSLSGFMNVTAGIGGPPIVVYAATTGWPHREYLATMQLYFTGLSILSLAGRGLPDLPPAGWVIAAGSATLGLVIGNLAHHRISDTLARRLVYVVAVAGSVATLVRGIMTL